MFDGGTVIDGLSSTFKGDPSGEEMRRMQRRLSEAKDRAEAVSDGARTDESAKAFQAAMSLLPVLWRDVNRR